MKKPLLATFIIFYFSLLSVQAQKSNYYLEDQIFITATYNVIVNTHDSISQGGFSNGLVVGYVRDIPLNEQRNFGLGVGINYSIAHIYQNISIKSLDDGTTDIRRMESNEYIRNKFSLSFIEMPFEIRYRTSTIDKHKFFRSYLGFKVGYRLRAYTKLKTKVNEISYYNQPEFNWWKYAIYLNIGYGSWNFHVDYTLSKVFKDDTFAKPNDPSQSLIPMDMNMLNFGLTFYLI
ncbi:MAG: PorT family protein [Flavobacteriales bacterium]|nr:PorT family protein [Flavobacteriales bacterium]